VALRSFSGYYRLLVAFLQKAYIYELDLAGLPVAVVRIVALERFGTEQGYLMLFKALSSHQCLYSTSPNSVLSKNTPSFAVTDVPQEGRLTLFIVGR
jgi:hypothetical protein